MTSDRHLLMLGMAQPLPPHGGTRLRLLHLARQAAAHGRVTLAAVEDPPAHHDEAFALEALPWGHSRRSAFVRSITAPYLHHRLHSEAARTCVEQSDADLVQVSSIYFVRATERSSVPVILDAHNIEADIVATQASSDSSKLHRLRWRWETQTTDRYERAAVGKVAAVLACSDADAEHFEQFAKRVIVVPNGVDVAATPFRPVPANSTLAYLGMYSYRPNEIAALSLADDILPRVRQQIPDAKLRLIGAGPTPAMLERASDVVEVTGMVDEAVPELQQARVLVIALKAGSGTRLKAIEAMAAGVVVVSTTTGVAGLGTVDGEHVLIGDTPADLAAAVVRVLEDDDLAARLAENGRELASSRFDWSRCAEPMLELHDELRDS